MADEAKVRKMEQVLAEKIAMGNEYNKKYVDAAKKIEFTEE